MIGDRAMFTKANMVTLLDRIQQINATLSLRRTLSNAFYAVLSRYPSS